MAIEWGILARAVHVAAVVVWIGGVSFVTTVLLPAMKEKPPPDWAREFSAIERRFAPQVRISVLLVLASGLYMLQRYDLWSRFAAIRLWWMHLMVAVWLLFAALLFVIEPLVRRRADRGRGDAAPAARLARMLWLHRAMLVLSLLAVLAAVGGSNGLF